MEDLHKELRSIFQIQLENLEKMDLYYPRIKEEVVPLSLTGVSPRTFHSWRQLDMFPTYSNVAEQDRKWVKLNLIDFVWVKIIQSLRAFGMSFENIKAIKDFLFSKEEFHRMLSGNNFSEMISTFANLDREKEKSLKQYALEIMSFYNDAIHSGLVSEVEVSPMYQIITGCFIYNTDFSLIVCQKASGFLLDVIPWNTPIEKIAAPNRMLPHIEIPIRSMIEQFFNEPRSEKYSELFGFIDPKEKKVLESIRKGDFTELIIKQDGDKNLIIEKILDGDITDEKAATIRKILGLGNYQEVTLKYRNNKHLYFKNKKREI